MGIIIKFRYLLANRTETEYARSYRSMHIYIIYIYNIVPKSNVNLSINKKVRAQITDSQILTRKTEIIIFIVR